ncbi:MAG TPA: helix-turn-helix transcriptional regulator [Streptosporangiaceae bacterium]|nr:helix-turn-helix transcriptional regulator [Streptosporangiaceae bacterium]
MPNLSASDLAGRRLEQVRRRREWTRKELADRCAAIGAPHITAAVITDLETRRRSSRKITIDELLVLAYVLDVPPIFLFAPADGTEKLQITPDVEKDAIESGAWIADDTTRPAGAMQTHSAVDVLRVNLVMHPRETSSLSLLRYIAEVVEVIRWIDERLTKWRDDPDWQERHPNEGRSLTDTLVRCGFRIAQLCAWLERLGHTPPELSPDVAATLKGVGVPDWHQLVLERPEIFDVPEPGTSGAAIGDAIEEAVNEVIARGPRP